MRRPTARPSTGKGSFAPRQNFAPKRRSAPQPPRHIYRRSSAMPVQETLCGIKKECGACKYVNLEYQSSLQEKHELGLEVLKSADVLGGARLLAPQPSPKIFGYRSLFKLAVRPLPASAAVSDTQSAGRTSESPDAEALDHDDSDLEVAPPARFAIGLFAEGSHDVVDMIDCPLHTEALRRLLKDLRNELNASSLNPYDENQRLGDVRYIVARAAHLTGEIMLTFVVTQPLRNELRRIVEQLRRRGHKINSAHLNINQGTGNAIFGAETLRIAGSDRLRERVLDLDFEIGPTAFFQINPWQAVNLYRRVEQIAGSATSSAVAWDLYCGLGQISLTLARLGYKVMGIEENPEAVVAAEANAKKNNLSDKASFIAAKVEEAQEKVPTWARQPDLIVVNPSRRGLAPETRREIIGLLKSYPKTRLIYVSCNVETLARDLKEIVGASNFQVRQLESFDMFAQTSDMEWLAVVTN